MKLDVRYANHPDDSKKYDTAELRKHYLIETVFEADEIVFTYSHQARMIAGGVMPVNKAVVLDSADLLLTQTHQFSEFLLTQPYSFSPSPDFMSEFFIFSQRHQRQQRHQWHPLNHLTFSPPQKSMVGLGYNLRF